MSDQATEFVGQYISELCDLLGVMKIRMSPYHSQTNGQSSESTRCSEE